jgi:DNA primase
MFKDAIDKFDVVLFLEEHCADVNQHGDEVETLCVNCQDHEMSTNVNSKLGQCWKCGFKYNLVTLVMTTLGIPYAAAREFITKRAYLHIDRDLDDMVRPTEEHGIVPFGQLKPEKLPDDFESIYDNDDEMSRIIKEYMRSRGIGPRLWRRFGIGYSLEHKYFNCVIIPVTYEGRQVYFTSRSVKGSKKFRNPPDREGYHSKQTVLLGYDQLDLDLNFVCIGEGPFDALSLPNGLSPMGKNLSDTQIGMLVSLPVPEVFICLDGGARDDAMKLAESLVDYKFVSVVEFPNDTDPNDHIGNITEFLECARVYGSRLDAL